MISLTLLELRNISKEYEKKDGSSQTVLSDINLSINKGECFTIIGPNGSGKTTLLRIMGLIEQPSKGKVLFDGKDITKLSKNEKVNYRRRFSFVRQKPVVLNTTVYKNIAYGLKVRGLEPEEIFSKVKRIIEIVGLKGMETKNARSLSGGEMQRVAIAMNFILDSEIYLLDEVSANLDPQNIILLDKLISEIKVNKEKTIILSTHDRFEAIKLADRIGVLNNGKITQIDTPDIIFTSPKDEFTAQFVGYENIFTGTAIIDEKSGLNNIKINDLTITSSAQKEGMVKVCIRPESIVLAKAQQSNVSTRNFFKGNIKNIRDVGNICHIVVECSSETFLTTITKLSRDNLKLEIGSEVFINFKATDVKLL